MMGLFEPRRGRSLLTFGTLHQYVRRTRRRRRRFARLHDSAMAGRTAVQGKGGVSAKPVWNSSFRCGEPFLGNAVAAIVDDPHIEVELRREGGHRLSNVPAAHNDESAAR